MNSMIFNPLEEYEKTFKNLHLEKTKEYLSKLVKQANINIDENRRSHQEIADLNISKNKLNKKLKLWKFLRVLMCISLILIPLVIIKINPMIKDLKKQIENIDTKVNELTTITNKQMAPLNALFKSWDSINLIESTIENLNFDNNYLLQRERNMVNNFDFHNVSSDDQMTIDCLGGEYNDNPFLFETRKVQKMVDELYHGYRTIYWTETYRDSNGRLRMRTRSQVLHATVAKPKPYYSNKVFLNYCSQAGPNLSFSRVASNIDEESERKIERYIKKGEKKLKKLTDKAIKENDDFTSMSNTEFEVLFNATNRDNEVEFRTLFTPLAQTNMVDLILDKVQYGDDFNFKKMLRTTRISSIHSQGRELVLSPSNYYSNSYDEIESNFIKKNTEFFKAVYFDFAPILAIPIYQDKPMKGLEELPNINRTYPFKEYEVLANKLDYELVAHPSSNTKLILKCDIVDSTNNIDKICVNAYSFDIIKQTTIVPVFGGDGRLHNVPVIWDEYIPVYAKNYFFVSTKDNAKDKEILAEHNDLCIFK